jgi:signal transduction histidine kinase
LGGGPGSTFCGDSKFEIDFRNSPEINYVKIHLISILRNLVSNAIKYSAAKEKPVVQIYTSKEKNFVVLTVRDNGIGINLEKVKKIYLNRFGDSQLKPKAQAWACTS